MKILETSKSSLIARRMVHGVIRDPTVDFDYWYRLPAWDISEVPALFLGIDPDEASDLRSADLQLNKAYRKLERWVRRSMEVGEFQAWGRPPHAPFRWIDWAKRNDITLPTGILERSAAVRSSHTSKRDIQLQDAANRLAHRLRDTGRKLITRREIARMLASTDEWMEMTAARIERVIHVQW